MVVYFLVMFTGAAAHGQERLFEAANDAFQARNYDSALTVYHRIERIGIESANLYFNMGNAYFKNGDLGHAILYYMRAQRLDPSDGDIRSNLEFARSFTRVQMEGVELNPVSSFVKSLIGPYRLSTLAWFSSILFILLMALLIGRFGLSIRHPVLRPAIVTFLVLVIVASAVTTFKYRTDYLTRRAVLTREETPVRTGPSEDLEIELQGAPGLVVQIVDESGDWVNVLFENKRRGWVRKELVAEI